MAKTGTKTIQTTGKRKRSVARATLKAGSGIIRINKMRLEQYEPVLARLRIMEPLVLGSEYADKVDISVKCEGGGITGQTDAVRLAIAQALVEFSGDEALEEKFNAYDKNLLVADVRRAEASKPNVSKPRNKRQKSYR